MRFVNQQDTLRMNNILTRQQQRGQGFTGLAFKLERMRLGLSQEALASLLGVHKLTISHWETSVAAAPGYLPLALAAINRTTGGYNGRKSNSG
jgi:DNA-binding transcriptional regulator YiaG